MKICTDIVEKNKCPNLSILYTYLIAKNLKKYIFESILRKYNNHISIIEKKNYTLRKK